MKKKIKTIMILILIISAILFIYYDSTRLSVNRIKVRHQVLESEKISTDLEGLQIAVFSDLHYNNFMDSKRFENIVKKINQVQPDIILFLGDLYDEPEQYKITKDVEKELKKLLKQLQAPYGKFAVLGEEDLINRQVEDQVRDILYQSDFELLHNESLKIHYNGKQFFNLIGLPADINKSIDLEKAFEAVKKKQYNFVFMHTPDAFDKLPLDKVDFAVAGHSHYGQAYIPFYGTVFKEKGAQKYSHKRYIKNDTMLYVTAGVGTTGDDYRLFADPEVLIYTLKSK